MGDKRPSCDDGVVEQYIKQRVPFGTLRLSAFTVTPEQGFSLSDLN